MSNNSPGSLFERLRSLHRDGGLKAQLLRGGIGSAAVQVFNRILALASGIVLARMLGTEGYGTYAYAFAIMSLLSIPSEFGMPVFLMRDVAASYSRQQWAQLRGILIRGLHVVTSASMLVLAAGLLTLWLVRDGLDDARFQTTMVMLFVLPLAAIAKTFSHSVKGLHRVILGQALETLLQPLVFLCFVSTLFFAFPDMRLPQYAMLAQLVSVALLLGACGFWLWRSLPTPVCTIKTEHPPLQWVRSAVPFTLIGGAGLINNQADMIMLGWFRPLDEVGVYRVTSQGAMLVGFLLQAAATVSAPHFASLYAQGDLEKIGKLIKRIAVLATLGSLPVVALFVFFGADVLGFVFGRSYSSGHTALAILALGYLANVFFGPVGMLLQMVGQEAATARVLWFTAGLNIVLNLALIPNYGTIGAATATALSVALYHLLLRRRIRVSMGF